MDIGNPLSCVLVFLRLWGCDEVDDVGALIGKIRYRKVREVIGGLR